MGWFAEEQRFGYRKVLKTSLKCPDHFWGLFPYVLSGWGMKLTIHLRDVVIT
jgi:hypothetical protein